MSTVTLYLSSEDGQNISFELLDGVSEFLALGCASVGEVLSELEVMLEQQQHRFTELEIKNGSPQSGDHELSPSTFAYLAGSLSGMFRARYEPVDEDDIVFGLIG